MKFAGGISTDGATVATTGLTIGKAGTATGIARFVGTTSGVVTIQSADAAGTYSLTLPTDDGNNLEFLQTNGSGVLSWAAAAAAGANVTLSNLTAGSVAINTTLASDTDNTDALGTAAKSWSDLFLGNLSVITWSTGPSTSDVTLTHAANSLTFAGGTIILGTATATGGLTGNVTGNVTGSSGSTTGNAATVTGFTPAGGSLTLAGADAVTITTTGATNSTLPLGTKTLVATDVATLNSLASATALAWTSMKVGTDGEIPTFDASGNPAFVSVGTIGHVLTSGGTGVAPTFQEAAGGGASALTLFPIPSRLTFGFANTVSFSSNTTGYVSAFYLPFEITVNRITMRTSASGNPGTIFQVGIYSEDGQTKEVDVDSPTISTDETFQIVVSAVTLSAGVHYIVMIPNSGKAMTFDGWDDTVIVDYEPTGKPALTGTMSVSADTLPATFSPSSDISFSNNKSIVMRFDN